MGEWSKKIGEHGEARLEKFFQIVGWDSMQKGISTKCNNSEHLNEQSKPKETHGIDFLFTYINPLVSGELTNVVISCKYSTHKYPKSPTSVFKGYIQDLTDTMDCFDVSDIKNNILGGFEYSSIKDIGVLAWLSNAKVDNNDLIRAVAGARIKESAPLKTVFIIDNKRVEFILSVIQCIKVRYANYRHYFYYPNTGRNPNPLNRKNSGSILPVEYLNSSIIPIKLVNKDNSKDICWFLATIDEIEESDIIRLIGLSKDITTELAGTTIIAFPDYQDLLHSNLVNSAKQKFQDPDFTKTVNIISYQDLLTSL